MTANQRQLLLGAFFLVVLLVLGWYTLFLTDFTLFGARHEMVVHFPDANGLRQGDPVLVAGIRQGKVDQLTFDPSAELARRITATLRMELEIPLREGARIHIEDSTLLGGRQVAIDPGPVGAPSLPVDVVLLGGVRTSALTGLGEFVQENKERVTRIVEGLDEVVGEVRGGRGLLGMLTRDEALAQRFDEGVESARAALADAAAITADLRAGRGVAGRLVTDEELGARFERIATQLDEVTRNLTDVSVDMREGRGLIGRLLKDEQVADDAAAAVRSVREIAERANAGEGTIGKLLANDEVYTKLVQVADDISAVSRALREGEGTLGKLMMSDEVYVRLEQVAENLAAVSSALRNAEGTIGKLVMDPDLYEQLDKAVGLITKSLEEYREAAPITTFTAVLFGAF